METSLEKVSVDTVFAKLRAGENHWIQAQQKTVMTEIIAHDADKVLEFMLEVRNCLIL